MKRLYSLALLGLLSACAPAQIQRTQANTNALPFQADFTDAGVTWVAGGKAFVARAPSFRVQPAPLPTPAVAAAWVGSVAWGALPDAGLIVTLDGPPETQVVGRAVRLSHQRVYLQDGSAVTYSGSAADGLLGFPAAVLTGGDGEEYALVGGNLYRPGSPPTLLSAGAQSYLYSLPGRGAATANVPTVQTDAGLYRLTGAALERLDGAGKTVTSLPHGPGLIGTVGGRIVTLSAAGQLRVFLSDLREVRP
ncbi:hypothetical protein GCM10022631_37010 [Deinococcus rubellus]|uniref:Uncharacterized protein n=1 Tax=Deinococcus rubellus TaxID=1889240 RepID=A0ABY5YFI7_9DEIO|nr:hypothetical protein [Deinococcus rubellus]UWX62931.1 hypothetical protein N0D28_09140 [Deinococcus rubellus]